MTSYTITSENGARRVIGARGSNVATMRRDIGSGLYVRVEPTKTHRVSASKLSDGYVTMTCANSNGENRTVSIFVGDSPERNEDGDIIVSVKPVMVQAWTKFAIERALKQIDAITNRRESDLTTKVSICPDNLIKHVIGARGSGLRRLEREIGDGCYISCVDGVFVIKANKKKSTLRAKLLVEKKVKDLIHRFREQKFGTASAEVSDVCAKRGLGANPFSFYAEESDESDDEAVVVVATEKPLSKSAKRRNRQKAAKAAKAATEKMAADGVANDEAIAFVSERGDWSSVSTSAEDTVDATSESSASPLHSLSGVWGAQDVSISESLEDARIRGDTFSKSPNNFLPSLFQHTPEPKKSDRDTPTRVSDAMDKKFREMTEKFTITAWDSDSDDEQ